MTSDCILAESEAWIKTCTDTHYTTPSVTPVMILPIDVIAALCDVRMTPTFPATESAGDGDLLVRLFRTAI